MTALPVSGPIVEPIVAARFALDGGAFFGIVPRPLWQRALEPDPRHRIPLVARVLLVRDRERGLCVLVDAGLGSIWNEKERDRWSISDDDGLGRALGERGLSSDDVTDVVLTHLHWDHARGTLGEAGRLVFPRAQLHVSRTHLEDASCPSPKDAGSYRRDDIDVLVSSGRLRVHETFGEWLPRIVTAPSAGHCEGLAVVTVGEGDGPRAVFPSDLVPTSAHVRPAWVAAYDNQPRVTVREKIELLGSCAARGDVVVFDHDPTVAAARVRPGEKAFEVEKLG